MSHAITPRRAVFRAAGGNGSVAVTAPPGCAWTATSNVPWITLTGTVGGSGNGPQTYSVAPYTGRLRRVGTLTVGGQTFTVTQTR